MFKIYSLIIIIIISLNTQNGKELKEEIFNNEIIKNISNKTFDIILEKYQYIVDDNQFSNNVKLGLIDLTGTSDITKILSMTSKERLEYQKKYSSFYKTERMIKKLGL